MAARAKRVAKRSKARASLGSLRRYREKRDFAVTPEPSGRKAKRADHRYLIQKHAARRLHYDFRLELDGVLKSWAVTRGPSLDPADKRLAVHVEDHPLDYGDFEGTIPEGQYGGGTVMLWDEGTWEPVGDPREAYAKGNLKFVLRGRKLRGEWHLVRMHARSDDKHDNWLLIKSRDAAARPGDGESILAEDRSVKTGRAMEEIAAARDAVWQSDRAEEPRRRSRALERAPATRSAPRLAARPDAAPGARKGPLPAFIAPQLATRVERPPAGEGWLHEIKHDGYRVMARLQRGTVKMLTRRGLDWTDRFRAVADAIAGLRADAAMIDGEVVALEDNGRSSFSLLQERLSAGTGALAFIAFDLLHLDGVDLRASPLAARKALLRGLLPEDEGALRYSDHLEKPGDEVFQHACALRLEGIVSKRAADGYVSGRTTSWLKSKCGERQEFVIGGFTESTTRERGLGAIALGVYEGDRLVYAGKVGTGFTHESSFALRKQLDRLVTTDNPFAAIPREARRGVVFVQPKLVCEVEFTGWTRDNLVRQGSFQGLREDKPARGIAREQVVPMKAVAAKPARARTVPRKPQSKDATGELAGVRLTHPDRVLYPDQGITKRRLAEYYVAIADSILPHVADRPLSLVRCPEGTKGACFYQKHLSAGMAGPVRTVPIEEASGTSDYVSISDVAGLVALVQFGVLEIHPWNARNEDVEACDRLIFDLDPSPEVAWADVVAATRDVKARLDDIGLTSFLKTTGGKGLHVVVPLAPAVPWDVAKAFAKALADAMAAEAPDRYIAKMTKAARAGRIFVDYLRNQRGATAVAPYSTRARPGAPISTPLEWSELSARLKSDRFHIADIAKRPTSVWKDYFKIRQTIAEAVARKLMGGG